VKLHRLLWAAMMVAVLAAAGCGGGSSSPSGSAGTGDSGASVKKGGLLRIGTTDGYDSMNPFVAFSAASYVAFTNTYPVLVQYDENFKIEGDWAENGWQTSADGLTWTFKVKPGKWSDGQPLTADDAAWTGNTIIKYADGATGVLAPFLTHATKVSAPDPQTVVITYDERVSNVLPQLQQFFILPKHIWESHTGNNGKDLKAFNPAADGPIVGGGSFYVDKYDKKGTTIYKQNPGYYGSQKPNVDAIGIQFFENSDAMLASFKSGEIDQMDTVPYLAADDMKKDPKYIVRSGDGTEVRDFGFNSNPKKTKHRELLDPKVKAAMAMAMNRQEIVDVVFAGYAKPAWSLLTPLSAPYLNTDLKPETYDIDAANKALDDLGYKKGSDGIRVVPATTGQYAEPEHKMKYEIITPSSLYGVSREFNIIRDGLQQIGIEVTQNSLDGTTAFEEIGAPDWKYLNFDMMMWDWIGYIDPDFVLSIVQCNQYGSWSDTGYCNAEYDKLYKEQGVAKSDAERKDIVWRMQQILYDEKPYVQLVQVDLVTAFQNNWGGFTPPFLNGLSKRPWVQIGQTG
jgi:peptide/nickel transport system substrate-binding protein